MGQPILVTVDPRSFHIYEIVRAERCDQVIWQESFEAILPKERKREVRTISDGAEAIRATAESSAGGHWWGRDHFHALRPLSRLANQLEERAYYFIDEVEKMEKRLKKQGSFIQALENDEQWRAYQQAMEESILDFDQFSVLFKWLKQALWWIDPKSGTLRKKEQALEECEEILQLMSEELRIYEVPRAILNFQDHLPSILHYFDDIPALEKQLANLIDEEFYRQEMILYYHYWFKTFQSSGETKKYYQKQADWCQTFLIEDLGEEAFVGLWQQVRSCFEEIVRASSYVENINSRLRRFFNQSRGQLNQNRLNLIRFYLNHKILRRGKRQGASATQLYNSQTQPKHWLEVLREIEKEQEEIQQSLPIAA